MDDDRKKWIAAAAGAAAVLLIAGGLMLRHRPNPDPGPAATAPGDHPPAPLAVSAAAPSRDAAGKPRINAVEVEICGRGKVPLGDDEFAVPRFLEATTHKAWERWLSAMLDSGDNRARAAGLLLKGKLGNGELVGKPMTDESRDELVQLAAGAGDPAVYAMAVYACGILSAPAGGSCSRISLSAWAALDPGNAVPWLSLAAAARANHDAAAEADAFARAAAAGSINAYNWFLLSYAETDMPRETTPLERQFLSVQIMGVMAALPTPYGIASKHCTAEALLQADVHEECNALAELMVRQGTTLLDLGFGKGLGARLGWPKQRVDALEQERDALLGAAVLEVPHDAKEGWSCSAAERTNAYLGRFDALGELGAAREILERSGETVPSMALKWKAYWEQLRKESAGQVQEDQPQDVSR
jgi:hypothetical protein